MMPVSEDSEPISSRHIRQRWRPSELTVFPNTRRWLEFFCHVDFFSLEDDDLETRYAEQIRE